MNRLTLWLLFLLPTWFSGSAQKPAGIGANEQLAPAKAGHGAPGAAATAAAERYRIKYDHSALRIPGGKFAIGLNVPAEGKKGADTIGFPGKQGGWGKYHVEVDSGSFSGGMVKLGTSASYKKGDSVTVSVYTKKWLLGGRGRFLVSRKILYDFEDSIAVITSGNAGRAPGDHVHFGVRTFYDDGKFSELWYPVKKKDRGRFVLGFDGGHLSTKKGDWKIDPDPTHIVNDRIRVFAQLAKAPSIRDTLSMMLDYTANYSCTVLSAGDGHELDATVDVFDDTIIHSQLLRVDVRDSMTHRTYHYLLNTKGSSITITSAGAAGADGANGMDGIPGTNGADGGTYQIPQTTTNPDGTTTTTYIDAQGPGGDGGNGGPGDDGQGGGNGGNGGNVLVRFGAGAKDFLGMIHVNSVPGAGGAGGLGGSGGSGGQGGSGAPAGHSGFKGQDGNRGADGVSGKTGTVEFLPYL